MIDSQRIKIKVIDDAILLIGIDTDRTNALKVADAERIAEAMNEAVMRNLRAVVVHSEKRFVFSSGSDIEEIEGFMAQPEPEKVMFDVAGRVLRAFSLIEDFPKPTIAAMEGLVNGMGLELALACDIRIAAETSTFALPQVRIGISPGAGATQRLTRLIGPAKAKEMILTGQAIRGDEARSIGLVNRLALPGKTLEEAIKLARMICSQTSDEAVRLSKQAINIAAETDLKKGLAEEQRLFGMSYLSKEPFIRIKSARNEDMGKRGKKEKEGK